MSASIPEQKDTDKISVAEDRLKIKITDDGVGFNPEKSRTSPERRCLGLMSMSERTESMGGRFSVRSRTGKGTEIAVEVPL